MEELNSQEVAFMGDNKVDETFKFDQEDTQDTDSALSEDNETVSDAVEEDAEEQKVPYSRFKKKVEELEERESIIASLEERLSNLENNRQESNPEDLEVPQEWTDLYGDSDVSKRAYQIQVKREMEIEERATQRALQQFRDQSENEVKQIEQNESIIDENLNELQETLGIKITPRIEEEVLSIVDEFSPVGSDGKYVTLFPFDKAYEIYQLRNSKATQATKQARTQIANLAGNSSEGETDSSEASFKRGWDSWRDGI